MRRILLTISISCVLAGALSIIPSSSDAQELIRRQTLFERLFGGPRREGAPPAVDRRRSIEPQRQRARPPARRSAPRQSQRRSAPAAAPVQKNIVEKAENASRVLVVGDFMAGGLAAGLEQAYAENPNIRIIDKTNGSSGLVRNDYYDWNANIEPILKEVEPNAVVVMIGANDRQSLTIEGAVERPQTEAWRKEYIERVNGLIRSITDADLPFLWAGMVPFKATGMSADMNAFNDIYKMSATAVGGVFVDVWDGFVDNNGSFIISGPDMNGQPVRLRGDDGINLTTAGRRKVAFYVESPLAKILGAANASTLDDEDEEDLEDAASDGTDTKPMALPVRTEPIFIESPELDGSSELLGANSIISRQRTDLLEKVDRTGRADNFIRHPMLASPPADDQPVGSIPEN